MGVIKPVTNEEANLIYSLYVQERMPYKEVARNTQISKRRVERFLRESGLFRSKSEAVRLLKRPEFYEMSEGRWRELYLEGDRPSMDELARRLGTCHQVVKAYLLRHKIPIRDQGTQKAIDIRYGRHGNPGLIRGKPNEAERAMRSANMTKINASNRTKDGKRKRSIVLKAARARKKPYVITRCAWCAKDVLRKPSEYARHTRSYCNNACSWKGVAHFHYRPEDPRPLILARLRELFATSLPHGTPMTLERLEKVGEAIGAGDAEYFELLMEQQEARSDAA